MIKINLLGEAPQVDSSAVVQVVAYFGSIVLSLVVFGFLYTTSLSKLSEMTERKAALALEVERLKTVTKEVKDLEVKRNDLRQKLVIIAKLRKSKLGPVRALDDINSALPEKSWLVSMKEGAGQFDLLGMALDNQTIADFMKKLESSDYFKNIDLVETRQADKQGVRIKSFAIKAQVVYSGKVNLALAAGAEAVNGEKKTRRKHKVEE